MLIGQYYIPHECGILIVDFSSSPPSLHLKTVWQAHQLSPEEFGAGLQVPFSFGLPNEIDILAKPLESIFQRTLTILESLPDNHRELLYFCISGGFPAVELLEQIPALGYLCAHYQASTSLRSYKDVDIGWIVQKRVLLLKKCGFIPKKWVVRIFQKIPAAESSSVLFHDLKHLLETASPKSLKKLQHLRSINHIVVQVLLEPKFERHFHPSCLNALSKIYTISDKAAPFTELHRIRHALFDAVENGAKFSRIHSLEDLEMVHDELVTWLGEGECWPACEHAILGPPPLKEQSISTEQKSNYGIFPLTDSKALWREGKKMHHCIAAYSSDIAQANGTLYAYHVEIPDHKPATLLIELQHSGWVISEICGPCNHPVSFQVQSYIWRWLEKQNKKQQRPWKQALNKF